MASVLMVSKPVAPPWNDSGKNLVKEIAAGAARYTFHLMSVAGAARVAERCEMEPVYAGTGSHAAGVRQNLVVLRRLLRPDGQDIYHFFFAPNRTTSLAARMVLSVKRRRTVHTISSAPRTFAGIRGLMFADRVVALSEHTRRQLEANGVAGVVRIPPCVSVGEPVSRERRERALSGAGCGAEPVVLYPGDYQFSRAASVCAEALPELLCGNDAVFVFACRVKREESLQEERRVRERVRELGVRERVRFLNEVPDMEALAAAAAVVVLPADSLYAKMDYPLVLLEAMREGVPVVVSDYGPLSELVAGGRGVAVPVGDAAALASAVRGLLADVGRGAALGAAGREVVRARYSAGVVAARYEELYDELLRGAGG